MHSNAFCLKLPTPLLSIVQQILFTAQDRFPSSNFPPVSTERSRAARNRLTKNRLILKYHRLKSAYVHNEEEVKQNAGLLPPVSFYGQCHLLLKLNFRYTCGITPKPLRSGGVLASCWRRLLCPHAQFYWAESPRFLHHNQIFDVIIGKSDYDIN